MHRVTVISLAACLLFACENPPEFPVYGTLALPPELGVFLLEDKRDQTCLRDAAKISRDFLTEKGLVPADYSFSGVQVWIHGTTYVNPEEGERWGQTYGHGDEIHVERYLRALAHEYFHSYRLSELGVDEWDEAEHKGWPGGEDVMVPVESKLDGKACR